MKILFIENRYRTIFWNAIGKALEKEKYEVFYLVQNPAFCPKEENVIIIPYPSGKEDENLSDNDICLLKSDRNINYFHHKETSHYIYYRKQIKNILNKLHPDIVFGESTAFHELITIEECKSLKIPYLQPSTCRFPIGRFSFYYYDTLEPFSGSDEIMDNETAKKLINSIVHRSVVPDYMKKQKNTIDNKLKRLSELIKLSKAYYTGEHYNTPNPIVKCKIEKQKKKLITQWDIIAEQKADSLKHSAFNLLYPIQMQPEANLDVWGRKYRNQLETLQQIIKYTPNDVTVIVKPNPKSKYELTEDLLSYIKSEKRIIPVSHATPMSEVLTQTQMVLTVTGTIAIECILSDIPVVTMIKTINNTVASCIWLESFSQLPLWIEKTQKKEFPIINEQTKIDFINLLNRTSFTGLPYNTAMFEDNIDKCMEGFRKILTKISHNI